MEGNKGARVSGLRYVGYKRVGIPVLSIVEGSTMLARAAAILTAIHVLLIPISCTTNLRLRPLKAHLRMNATE